MTDRARVATRVLVRGAVTAECDAAFLTRAEVNPSGAGLDALLAFATDSVTDSRDGSEVFAGCVCHGS